MTSSREHESEQPGKPREQVSFVIVLWLETGSFPEGPEWRWRVTSAQPGRRKSLKRKYFRRVSDVLAYVSAETGVAPPR